MTIRDALAQALGQRYAHAEMQERMQAELLISHICSAAHIKFADVQGRAIRHARTLRGANPQVLVHR